MSNRAGQAYAFMAITPILAGREAELRSYLESLSQSGSPFVRLPRTHFARWVILPDWADDPSQPKQDHLESQYLIFTSNFDGSLSSYLDELSQELAAEAVEIWGRCAGCPASAAGAELKSYLLHNQINTGFFVAAYPDASVERVRMSLAIRDRLIALAVSSQEMNPSALQTAFNAEFGA